MFGIRRTLAAAVGVLLLSGTAYAAEPFTLTSPAFKDGGLLTIKNAGNNKANRIALAKTYRRHWRGPIRRPAPRVSPS
jgi:hypothetical protein